MIYRIREKFWRFGDSLAITDDAGATAFVVRIPPIRRDIRFSIRDPAGNELAFVRQRPFTFRLRFWILVNGAPFAEMVRVRSLFRYWFALHLPGPDVCTIEGSFSKYEFSFERCGRPVAFVTKRRFDWQDSYAVEIEEGVDDVSILCACIVIDRLHSSRPYGSTWEAD